MGFGGWFWRGGVAFGSLSSWYTLISRIVSCMVSCMLSRIPYGLAYGLPCGLPGFLNIWSSLESCIFSKAGGRSTGA